jgi:hypothetical protein
MTRLPVIELDAATGKGKELLDELASRGGQPGPMVRAMANAAHTRAARMSDFLAWAAAIGAAGCGRCATAV